MRTLRCVGAKNPLRFHARYVSTIGNALESAVEKLPYREALRLFPNNDRNVGLRLSYSELDGFVNELTNGFLELKFKKGDTIALWLPNNAENVVAQLAAAKAGLTVASIDQSISTAEELSFVINDSKAVALLFEPKINSRNNTAIVEEVLSKKTGLYTAITTATDPVDGIQLFQHIMVNSLEPHFAAQRRTQIDASTPAVVAYTSILHVFVAQFIILCFLGNHGQKPKRSSVLTHGDVLNKAQEIISS
jgi:acyl-CoA synthetase (AMP-forming)/AMP-acid ligase II